MAEGRRVVTTKGICADVREGSDPALPVIVFVHGAMDRASTWDRVRRRLEDFTTVAYDRRGYASASHLSFGADAFDDHVVDLLDVLQTVADSRTAATPATAPLLVGHSAGSNVALAGATRVEVRGLFVWEPPMPWTDWWPSNAGGSTLAVFAEHGPEAAAESFMRRIVGDHIWERLPAATKAARRAEGLALVADLATLRGRPVQFDHGSVRANAMVGCGGRSIPHHRRGAQATAGALPAARLVELVDQGHGAHAGDPTAFAQLVRDLATVAAPPH